ncbi:hypothetical protein ABKN59_005292 [Abortiporus biennis]
MPSDVIRRNILDSFPGELFLYIKEQIPDCDLRTHVCFYNASPYFAASYGNNENKERLFEKAYIMSGLGILPHEDPKSISWVDLATRIILEDGFCDHPECGGSRLEQNVELMSRPDLMPTEPYWSNLKIYRKLFSYQRQTEGRWWRRERCKAHPIAARSFATCPPVDSILAMFHPDIDDAHPTLNLDDTQNQFGVTVLDVMTEIHKFVDLKLHPSGVLGLLESTGCGMEYGYECSIEHSNLVKSIPALKTLRGFLNYFHLDGLDFTEWNFENYPVF